VGFCSQRSRPAFRRRPRSLYLLHESDDVDTAAFEALAATSSWDPGFIDSYAQHFWRTNPGATGSAARRGRGHGQRHAGSPQFAGADGVLLRLAEAAAAAVRIGGTFLRRGGVSAHISVLHASPMAEQDTSG